MSTATPPPKRKSILSNSSVPPSPTSPQASPSSTHTYTSLASVRRANKGKEPERGDRKNGWHLWSVEESQQTRGRAEETTNGNGGGDVEGGTGADGVRREVMDEKSGERRMTQWDLVSTSLS